jgi:hypothetical protein
MLMSTFIANITGYVLVDRGSIPGRDSVIFSTPQRPDRLWGPPSFLYDGYQRVLSVGVKLLGRDANHSPLLSVEVKEWWRYISIPSYISMALFVIKHGGKFALPYLITICSDYRRGSDWWMNSQITIASAEPFRVCCVFTSLSLATASGSGDSSASCVQALSSQPPVQNSLSTNFFLCL